MDVEGYEYNIIKGATDTLKKDVKILMEIHPFLMTDQQLTKMIEILEENNFKAKFIITEQKVCGNWIAECFMHKVYGRRNITLSNVSITELRKLLRIKKMKAHHVLFSKE